MNCSYCARAASLAAMLVAQAKLPILLPRWCFFFSFLFGSQRKEDRGGIHASGPFLFWIGPDLGGLDLGRVEADFASKVT